MCYNPLQIIKKLESLLKYEDSNIDIEPFYKGFNGEIIKLENKKYVFKGAYEIIGIDKIKITELPIGLWTQDYKEYLESLLVSGHNKQKEKSSNNLLKDYNDMSTDSSVEFTIVFYPGILTKLLQTKHDYGINGVEKLLKLYVLHSTSNMHLFNEKEQLKKYDTVEEIIEEYYSIRLEYYNKRKEYLIDKLSKELIVLSNKARYIKDTLDDKIDLRKKSKDQINTMLENMKFDTGESGPHSEKNFNYLIKMPMDSVCQENVDKLINEQGNKQAELDKIRRDKIEEMWLNELTILRKEYMEFISLENKIHKKNKQK